MSQSLRMSGRFSPRPHLQQMVKSIGWSQSLRMSGRFSPNFYTTYPPSPGGRNPFVCQVDSVFGSFGRKGSGVPCRNPFVCQVDSVIEDLRIECEVLRAKSQSLRMSGRFSLSGLSTAIYKCKSQSLRMSGRFSQGEMKMYIKDVTFEVAIPSYVRSIQS